MSFLDKFRVLITEIGNTLGYVRMVRSAGMHVCSEAVQVCRRTSAPSPCAAPSFDPPPFPSR